jgi:hypothetical protein
VGLNRNISGFAEGSFMMPLPDHFLTQFCHATPPWFMAKKEGVLHDQGK